jgi:hypothetical protein
MIDHIIVHASEAAARSALPSYCSQDSEGAWHWDASRVIPGLKIITSEAPEVVLPGYWVAVALPALSTALRDLPNEACRLIANRDLANAGQAFMEYAAPSIDMVALSTARVAPVFAGSNYPFG